jgi:hypothetical protein
LAKLREAVWVREQITKPKGHSRIVTVPKTPAQLEREITAALAKTTAATPAPPPSIRTDRQRQNWYWRKFQLAQKKAAVIANKYGIDSGAYRDADAIRDAFQHEWEWYSALLQGDES